MFYKNFYIINKKYRPQKVVNSNFLFRVTYYVTILSKANKFLLSAEQSTTVKSARSKKQVRMVTDIDDSPGSSPSVSARVVDAGIVSKIKKKKKHDKKH